MMKIRPSVVLQREDAILLLRYEYSGKSVFQLPGGNMEAIESLEETLSRELMEELNLPIQVSDLLLTAQVIQQEKQKSTLHCVFSGAIIGEKIPEINRQETTAIEFFWLKIEELTSIHLYPAVGETLKNILLKQVTTPQYLGVLQQPWL